VQAVVIERDEEGRIVGEKLSEPTALFTPEQLPEFVEKLRSELAAADGQTSDGNVAPKGVPQ
jgi:hypothetical protein